MTINRIKQTNLLSIAQSSNRKSIRRNAKVKNAQYQQHLNVQRGDVASSVMPIVEDTVPVFSKNTEIVDPQNLYPQKLAQAMSVARPLIKGMSEPRLLDAKELLELGIVNSKNGQKEVVNSIRQIKSRLFTIHPDGNFSVVVTSLADDDSGSFIAKNLAASIAYDQTKTSLLIDCNIEKPSLDPLLGILGDSNPLGLMDHLFAPEDILVERIIMPSGIPRMRIVPVGSKQEDVDEFFTSNLMVSFLQEVKGRYRDRYVILDAPSIQNSTDAKILANICDYIILVVPYGQVSTTALDSVVDELGEGKLVGVVLNDEPVV